VIGEYPAETQDRRGLATRSLSGVGFWPWAGFQISKFIPLHPPAVRNRARRAPRGFRIHAEPYLDAAEERKEGSVAPFG